MSEPTQDELDKIQHAADELGEYFDTVAIFVTRHDGEGVSGTYHAERSTGNYYAIYGQIRQWIRQQEEPDTYNIVEEED